MAEIKDNLAAFHASMDYISNHDGLQPERKSRFVEGSHYEPYSNDREFMEREGEPCRHCLHKFNDHHNGQCPKGEDD